MSTAAVGSLMIRTTSSPASSPAWRVAWRWPSLKKAGTVITTFDTGVPSTFSARCLSVFKMIAEISCGEYFWSPRVTVTSWPIFRLIDRTVRSGARTYWLRAALPTSRCPCGIQTDDRRQDRVAVLLEDHGPAIANDRDLAVGRSQVDADDRVGIHVVIPRSARVEPDRSIES